MKRRLPGQWHMPDFQQDHKRKLPPNLGRHTHTDTGSTQKNTNRQDQKRHFIVKNSKYTEQRKFVERYKKKTEVTYKEKLIRIMYDFSIERVCSNSSKF